MLFLLTLGRSINRSHTRNTTDSIIQSGEATNPVGLFLNIKNGGMVVDENYYFLFPAHKLRIHH
jgi:hypothetical protein